MAISAPVVSTQYANFTAKPPTLNFAYDWGAKLRASEGKLTFTAAGFTSAAAGDLQLIRMPPGKIRILSDLCRIMCPQGTATSTLDVGLGAYTKTSDGSTVALAGAQLASALAVGAGIIDQTVPLPAVGLLEIESTTGFDIVASFATANSPASGDLIVIIAYMQGN